VSGVASTTLYASTVCGTDDFGTLLVAPGALVQLPRTVLEGTTCTVQYTLAGGTVVGVTQTRVVAPETALEANVVLLPECGDGVDNDGDGLIDYPTDPGCASTSSLTESPACNDGLDNDGDGVIDLADPGCQGASDDSENSTSTTTTTTTTTSTTTTTTTTTPTTTTTTTLPPACGDGLDNDGDGLTDYPADPGCRYASSTSEKTQCQDGLDNDADGKRDFDGGASRGVIPPTLPDPQCTAAWVDKEAAATGGGGFGCGIGPELALLIPALLALRRRRES
jgi:hypothetical protein